MRSPSTHQPLTPLRNLLRSWSFEALPPRPARSLRHLRNATTAAPKSRAASEKIMVRPFAIEPEVAKAVLNEEVLGTTGHPLHRFLRAHGIRKDKSYYDWITNAHPIFGKVKLVNFKAVYWPIWRFTYISELTAVKRAASVSGVISLEDYFIPGNHHSPLSSLDFRRHLISCPVPLPLTSNPSIHLYPLNPISSPSRTDISSPPIIPKFIPFSISPFDVLDLGKQFVPKGWRYSSRLEGEEEVVDFEIQLNRDVREYLIAAYPVYQPLYIAEYDFTLRVDRPARRIALVMDASDRAMMKVHRPNGYPEWHSFQADKGYWQNRKYQRTDIDDIPEPIIYNNEEEYVSVFFNPPIDPYKQVGWLESLSTTVLPPESPLEGLKKNDSSIPWADVRIQRYGGEDYDANVYWCALTNERFERNRDYSRIKRGLPPLADDAFFKLAECSDPVAASREMSHEADRLWEKHRPTWMSKAGSRPKGTVIPDPSGKFIRGRR